MSARKHPLGPNLQALLDESKPGCCVACDTYIEKPRTKLQRARRKVRVSVRWLCCPDRECQVLLRAAVDLDARDRARKSKYKTLADLHPSSENT